MQPYVTCIMHIVFKHLHAQNELVIHNQTCPMAFREGSELLKGLHFLPTYSSDRLNHTQPNPGTQWLPDWLNHTQWSWSVATAKGCAPCKFGILYNQGFIGGLGGAGILPPPPPSSPTPPPTTPLLTHCTCTFHLFRIPKL